MKVLQSSHSLFFKIINPQKLVREKKYRLFSYCVDLEYKGKFYLYNTLTSELLCLENAEGNFLKKEILSGFDFTNQEYLVEKYFWVPVEHDDCSFYKSYLSTMQALSVKPYKNTFTILPTTDCNARCFYCFEKNCKKLNITPQIADDIADFIIKSSHGNMVKILWFGGEPLFNDKAIDLISKRISASGIEYASKMISNGYLFDEKRIEKAKELWNLKQVQITIDGTEKIYNKRKAYIYTDDSSPFLTVMGNIESLLKHSINVLIRLNMDDSNFCDLMNLADYLSERFSRFKNFSVYVSLIYDSNSSSFEFYSSDIQELYAKREKVVEKLRTKKIYFEKKLENRFKLNQCIADNPNALIIYPDGKLGKCEHHMDTNHIGSIYEDEINTGEVANWRKYITIREDCYKCKLFPQCLQLLNCKEFPNFCLDRDREFKLNELKLRIINKINSYYTEAEDVFSDS